MNLKKDANLCGDVPELIEKEAFKKCMKGGPGGRHGPPGAKSWKGGKDWGKGKGGDVDMGEGGAGRREGPEMDVAPGDGQLSAMKRRRVNRAAHKGGKGEF